MPMTPKIAATIDRLKSLHIPTERGKRERTRAFTELQSHYLFRDRFGRPGKGNDKARSRGW